jgi:hypothetical protein
MNGNKKHRLTLQKEFADIVERLVMEYFALRNAKKHT